MIRPRPILPAALLIALAGCSATRGIKLAPKPSARSIPVVGERALPSTVGDPESGQVAADVLQPEPRRDPLARISGRVYDAGGRPVADALVRLADGGQRGGHDSTTRTDRSGAFTLGNLRPGGEYVLVAEADTDAGPATGRARARTADTGIAIRLGDDDDSIPAAGRPARPRARPISIREPGEASPTADDPEANPPARPGRKSSRWPGRDDRPGRVVDDDDEMEDPLPPAIEPEAAAGERPQTTGRPGPVDAGSIALADEVAPEPRPSPATRPTALAVMSDLEPDPAPAVVAVETTGLAATTPSIADPGSPPPAAEDLARADEPYNPFLLAGAAPPAPLGSGPPPDASTPAPDGLTPAPAPVGEGIDVDDRPPALKSKTWGDVAKVAPTATAISPKPEPAPSGFFGRLRRGGPAPAARPASIAACEYDDRQRRLVDLTMPDLGGRPVRLRDLDADLILLDFWGTWCRPCADSIPRLVELQKTYGPARLRVVGVACERTAEPGTAARVDQFARKLGINYTVVLSTMDGSCPLQNAFRVQFYPTMVLLDRTGRVLWTDQGSTPATLGRLDRAIKAAITPNLARRDPSTRPG